MTPSDEQRLYWSRDLFYKKLALLVSGGGFILIIAGLLFTHRQISINTEQLRLNTTQSEKVAKSIRANVENATVTHVTTLDRIFIENPSLTPYFYERKTITDKDKDYPKVTAIAFMELDVFDLVVTQNKHYPEFWDTPGAWDEWVIDSFANSPILRDTLDKYPSWYGNSLKDLAIKGKAKAAEQAAEAEPSGRPREKA